jgi:hypothetical protein
MVSIIFILSVIGNGGFNKFISDKISRDNLEKMGGIRQGMDGKINVGGALPHSISSELLSVPQSTIE